MLVLNIIILFSYFHILLTVFCIIMFKHAITTEIYFIFACLPYFIYVCLPYFIYVCLLYKRIHIFSYIVFFSVSLQLDCSSGADPSSPSPYKLQTSALPVSRVEATPTPLFMSNEKSRCEQFAKNLTYDQEAVPKAKSNVDKCPFCLSQQQEGSNLTSPVEGKDYFIDGDGTLSIKNGVCPRSLALKLFSEVFFQRLKYAQLLGENFVKFLMNLKQIITRHKRLCPGENPYDFMKAENVLKNFSFTTKECLELANRENACEHMNTLKLEETKQLKAMEYNTVFSNTSYNSLDGVSNGEHVLQEITSEKDKKLIISFSESAAEHDLVCNSNFTVNTKGRISDNGSPKSSSRISSPSLSHSSVNSGPSGPDRSKQVTSTKRGCKVITIVII